MAQRLQRYNSEANVHQAAVNQTRLRYPNVLLRTDYAAGLKLTMGQAKKHKAMQGGMRSWPDLQIAEPVGQYHGLFTELKKDGVKLIRDKDAAKILKGDYKLRKKGDWWDLHTEEQAETLAKLRAKGYAATFCVGIDDYIATLETYMHGGRITYAEASVTNYDSSPF